MRERVKSFEYTPDSVTDWVWDAEGADVRLKFYGAGDQIVTQWEDRANRERIAKEQEEERAEKG
eukprot:1996957-Alexandrium_andersonii.AAC.1